MTSIVDWSQTRHADTCVRGANASRSAIELDEPCYRMLGPNTYENVFTVIFGLADDHIEPFAEAVFAIMF
jgi:hypothetical protein